ALLATIDYIDFFFFSSRRRHTRSKRDWSSDVCSSDLHLSGDAGIRAAEEGDEGLLIVRQRFASCGVLVGMLRNVVDEPPISLQESIPRLIGHRFRTCFRFRDGDAGPGAGPGQGGQMRPRRAAS